MELLDGMMGQEMEFEGSATAAAHKKNISTDIVTNVTNVTFSPYYQHSLYVAASYILAYFFIFLLCMVGNILVCLIVLENHRMRTVTNLFILNLAISDLLVGIFCIPTTLVDNLITGEAVLLVEFFFNPGRVCLPSLCRYAENWTMKAYLKV